MVEAHKEFAENTFFHVHNLGLRVAVVSNQTCILSDIDAYDFGEQTNSLVYWGVTKLFLFLEIFVVKNSIIFLLKSEEFDFKRKIKSGTCARDFDHRIF